MRFCGHVRVSCCHREKLPRGVKSFVFPWCWLVVQGHLKPLAVWLCHHKARLPSDHSRWWLMQDEGVRRSCLMYFRGYIFNTQIKPPFLTATCWACICHESTCSETWSEMYCSERLSLCLIHVDLVWTLTCSDSYTLTFYWHFNLASLAKCCLSCLLHLFAIHC